MKQLSQTDWNTIIRMLMLTGKVRICYGQDLNKTCEFLVRFGWQAMENKE
jgi:hypothetical protein